MVFGVLPDIRRKCQITMVEVLFVLVTDLLLQASKVAAYKLEICNHGGRH
jgi:hypothetical protein